MRRSAALRVGGFRPELRFAEDWEYWVRLAALGRFVAARGRAPVLFVRRRAAGAYLGAAADPAAFAPALAAAYAAPGLAARFGAARLARLRARMEAEAEWVAGRALLWHGRRAEALARLRLAWVARPGVKRAVLLAWWRAVGAVVWRARGAPAPPPFPCVVPENKSGPTDPPAQQNEQLASIPQKRLVVQPRLRNLHVNLNS